jgi:arginase
MAIAALTGHGDPDIPNVAEWGIQTFSPDQLCHSTRPLLTWLAATGCSRVAIHFDVDTVDSNEIVLGLGAVPHGLTSRHVRCIVADISPAADVVGLTIAEFFPRQVLHLQQILEGFPPSRRPPRLTDPGRAMAPSPNSNRPQGALPPTA